MIVVKIYFKDEILECMQLEEILHPYLLMANRKQFKDYLVNATSIWEKTNE